MLVGIILGSSLTMVGIVIIEFLSYLYREWEDDLKDEIEDILRNKINDYYICCDRCGARIQKEKIKECIIKTDTYNWVMVHNYCLNCWEWEKVNKKTKK